MSYYKIQQWFGFFKYKIDDIRISYKGLNIIIQRTPKEKLVCPVCKSSKIRFYGAVPRVLRDLSISNRITHILFHQNRIYCSQCGVHRERISFADRHARHTRRFERFIFSLCHYMTISDVSRIFKLSWDEVKNIDMKYLGRRYKRPPFKNLRIIGVDEIALKKGHTYLTIVVNLEKGEVIYVGKGRKQETLETFFYSLGPTRCRRIKAIAMDIWSPYISAAQNLLPKAKIVFDKFHILSSFGRVIDTIRRNEYTLALKEDREIIKGSRYLLLKNKPDLSHNQKLHLAKLLSINFNLNLVYILKDDLHQLWKYDDKEEAENHLNLWIQKALETKIPVLRTFAETLERYKNGILNYYYYRITTAKVEGINNKIKVLKRKVYGFGDLVYFALKIFDLHNIESGFV